MKKLLTLLIFFIVYNINAQQSEFIVEHCAMNDTFKPIEGLICSNEAKTKWFNISPIYLTSTETPIPYGVLTIKFGIGKPTLSDKIVIRFSDNKTVILKAYYIIDKYGGTTNFYTNVSDISIMKTYPINSIKYINGIDGSSFTYQPKRGEENFFINAFTNFVVKEVKCAN